MAETRLRLVMDIRLIQMLVGQRGRVCKKEFVPTGNLSGGNCHDGATDRPSGASLAAWAGNETMQPQCEVASMGTVR